MTSKVKSNRDTLMGCLCAIGCEALFGFSYLFTKGATAGASALALLGWRFLVALAAMGLLAALGLVKVNLKGKNLKPLLLVALLSPILYFTGETFGIQLTTASESGAFLACIPVASVAASTLILKEKPTRRQVAGILVTLAGVLVTVFAVSSSASFSVSGYAMLLLAVVAYALYTVHVRKATGYTSAEITFAMLAVGAVFFIAAAVSEALANGSLVALATLPIEDRGFLAAVLYQGVGCSVLAFLMSNVAIAKIGVNRTSSFVGVSTVVSIVAGILILNESFTLAQAGGALVIVCGVYIANAKARERSR